MLGISLPFNLCQFQCFQKALGVGDNYGELLDDNLCPVPQKGWTWIRQRHRAARKALRQQFS